MAERETPRAAGILPVEAQPSGLRDFRCEVGLGVCGSGMTASYSTKKKRRYGYYVCEKAQRQGVAACPFQSIAGARLEGALLAGLQELAQDAARQPLREVLLDWGGLARDEQQRRLASVLERIDYLGQAQEARLSWRTPLMEGDPITIPVQKPAVTHALRLQPGESPGPAIPSRLPRITRLLALAVRFEGLLQEGTVRDYADLAQLGGVSRARITQIMSLRKLAPVIQERILTLPAVTSPGEAVNERLLRRMAQQWDWREQLRMWGKITEERTATRRNSDPP
jgi:Recombinase zinc beta ribbon domain